VRQVFDQLRAIWSAVNLTATSIREALEKLCQRCAILALFSAQLGLTEGYLEVLVSDILCFT
jgi:hypothetical protein